MNAFLNRIFIFQPNSTRPRKSKSDAIDRLYKSRHHNNNNTNNYFAVTDGNESGSDESDLGEEVEDSVWQTIRSVLDEGVLESNLEEGLDVQPSTSYSDHESGVETDRSKDFKHKERGWRNIDFHGNEQQFQAPYTEPTDIQNPLKYFKDFFTDEMFAEIAEETNKYYFQSKCPKTLDTNSKEIENFLGILFKMGIVKMPSVRDYWKKDTFCESVASHMSRNRFEFLCRYFHFVDNTDDCIDKSDKAWKIRPFLNALRRNFLKTQPDQHQCIDEISIAYKGKKGPRQYNPPKTFEMAFHCVCPGKLFGLCSRLPFVHWCKQRKTERSWSSWGSRSSSDRNYGRECSLQNICR